MVAELFLAARVFRRQVHDTGCFLGDNPRPPGASVAIRGEIGLDAPPVARKPVLLAREQFWTDRAPPRLYT
jgi:hypothetical protein